MTLVLKNNLRILCRSLRRGAACWWYHRTPMSHEKKKKKKRRKRKNLLLNSNPTPNHLKSCKTDLSTKFQVSLQKTFFRGKQIGIIFSDKISTAFIFIFFSSDFFIVHRASVSPCQGSTLIQPSLELRPFFFLRFFALFDGDRTRDVSSYHFEVLPTGHSLKTFSLKESKCIRIKWQKL